MLLWFRMMVVMCLFGIMLFRLVCWVEFCCVCCLLDLMRFTFCFDLGKFVCVVCARSCVYCLLVACFACYFVIVLIGLKRMFS